MKGTKLWNAAGSPLIQGRSRRERPFTSDWVTGWVVGGLLGGAVVVGVMMYNDSSVVSALKAVWLPVLVLSAAGSALGVWMASGFGWHPRWSTGAIAGGGAAFVGAFAYTAFVLTSLGG